MTPIQFALAEIRDTIPEELLTMAFSPKMRYRTLKQKRFSTNTVESQIIDLVINGRVRRYIDSQGAQEVDIPLEGLNIENIGTNAWTCHIPKTRTKGRRITNAISVHIAYNNTIGNLGLIGASGISTHTNLGPSCGKSDTTRMVDRIVKHNQPMTTTWSADVYLIDENTIFCEDRMVAGNLSLKCMIAADEEFSFIHGTYIQDFAELCLLATKAYIAKNLRITADKAYLESGMELGTIKEYIDSYADADEQFKEFVKERWRKIQRLSDKPRSMRYLDMITAPGH